MLVTVVAIMCQLFGNDPVCIEEIVTDSTMTEGLTFFGCMAGGQAPLAKWKTEHPIYHSERWYMERYKCVPGHYEIKGRA